MNMMRFLRICSATLALHSAAAFAQNAPLDSLVKTATQWVGLSDSNQTDRMWESSGTMMQTSINKQDWAKYLGNLRGELGAVQGRDWAQVARVVNPAGLPPGEYMNVIFSSRFARAAPIVEKISLTQASGRWVPVGYVVEKVAVAAQAAGKR